MHRYDLLQLTTQNSFVYRNFKDRLDFASMQFPVAENASRTTLWVAHPLFMGESDLVDRFVEAVEKVRANGLELKRYTLEATPPTVAHLRT
jgi:hypothetical protein